MAHTLIGTVTSDKRDKTITVSIVSRETHPLYRKQYSKTRKYTAHDENNEAHKGDLVQIAMCRPISRTKAYTLVKVIEKSRGTVELREDVNNIELPEKIGADKIVAAKKLDNADADVAVAEEADVDVNNEGNDMTEKSEGEDE